MIRPKTIEKDKRVGKLEKFFRKRGQWEHEIKSKSQGNCGGAVLWLF